MTVEELLVLLRQADRLEGLPRTGYIISRVPAPESVAAHSYGVCLCAMLLADQVRRRQPELDVEVVLRMAILHDIQEAVTTDIPGPVKRTIGKDVFINAERAAATSMLGSDTELLSLWERYEATTCLESRVVHAADRIQMFVKILQYESAGLGDLRRFWDKPYNFKDYELPEAQAILDRLRAYHEAGDWPVEDF